MDDFEKELAREQLHKLLDELLKDEELKRAILARPWKDEEGNTHIRDYHLILTVKDRLLKNEYKKIITMDTIEINPLMMEADTHMTGPDTFCGTTITTVTETEDAKKD